MPYELKRARHGRLGIGEWHAERDKYEPEALSELLTSVALSLAKTCIITHLAAIRRITGFSNDDEPLKLPLQREA